MIFNCTNVCVLAQLSSTLEAKHFFNCSYFFGDFVRHEQFVLCARTNNNKTPAHTSDSTTLNVDVSKESTDCHESTRANAAPELGRGLMPKPTPASFTLSRSLSLSLLHTKFTLSCSNYTFSAPLGLPSCSTFFRPKENLKV